MKPPGAPRSGFSPRTAVGPYELNEDMSPPVGFGALTRVLVHVSDARLGFDSAAIATPSACETATRNLPATGVTPPPTKSPGELLRMTTPTAPAATARWYLLS